MKRAAGFTLIEVVLAIALAAVVVYLVTTAIELYVVGVDASRTRVESAQLARAILDQIADDLTAVRGGAPSASPAAGGGGQGGYGGAMAGGTPNGGASASGGSAPGAGGAGSAGASPGGGTMTMPGPGAAPRGVFGTAELVRIDRAPLANWERSARQVDLEEAAGAADVPVTVRYFLLDAERTTAARLAQQGVRTSDQVNLQTAGLYRQTQPTAAVDDAAAIDQTPPVRPDAASRWELVAPEAAALAFRYFDGQEYFDEWPATQTAPPRGVEIRLTLVEPQFQLSDDARRADQRDAGQYDARELFEYRRFVRLPVVSPGPAAQPLATAAGGNPNPAGGGTGGAAPGGANQPPGAGAASGTN